MILGESFCCENKFKHNLLEAIDSGLISDELCRIEKEINAEVGNVELR